MALPGGGAVEEATPYLPVRRATPRRKVQNNSEPFRATVRLQAVTDWVSGRSETRLMGLGT